MSMDSCEAHGWWEVDGRDQCPTCEIASLRAEVERLQHINKELLKQKDGVDKDLFGIVCFERDEALHEARANAELVGKQTAKLASALTEKQEALAQVTVLCNIGDQIINRWWNVDGIKTLTDEDANPLADLRSALMVAGSDNVKHKARALLDRLQKAEARVAGFEQDGDTRTSEQILELSEQNDYLERKLQRAAKVVKALHGIVESALRGWTSNLPNPDIVAKREWSTAQLQDEMEISDLLKKADALAAWEEGKG